MPDRPTADAVSTATPPQKSPHKDVDWIRVLVAVGLALLAVRWLNKTFFASDAPITVEADALGAGDLDTIIATSKQNELKFKSDFVGKQFSASGNFKEANKDLYRYHITVTIGTNDVFCETNDQQTLNLVSQLSADDTVKIYGLIDDTWMGDLQLKRCAVTR